MSDAASDREIVELSRSVEQRMGLHFPPRRHADLWNGVEAAARDLGFDDASSCARWLSANPLTRHHIEVLASHLTIGETYFFREPVTLDALRDRLLPELIEARRDAHRRLRIWSAGCCTGEEPYSVAMILDALVPDLSRWEITLLATDINPVFLRKAAEGRYRPWSFRNCPDDRKERYFKAVSDGNHLLSERIRAMVTFEYLNLAEDHYPSLFNNTNAMDIILCRNVLMYFEPSVATRIVTRLGRSLVEGGYLIVAPSETSLVSGEGLVLTRVGDVSVYRRESQRVPHAYGGPDRRARTPSAPAKPHARHSPAPRRSAARSRRLSRSGSDAVTRLASACVEAEALYEGGRYADVVRVLRPHVKSGIRPSNARQWGTILRIMARAYANQGMLDEAEAWCREALKSDPDDPGLHYLLATILQEEGRLPEARMLQIWLR